MYIDILKFNHLPTYLSVHLSVYRFIVLSLHRFIYLSSYLPIYLSTYLSTYLPMFIILSTYISLSHLSIDRSISMRLFFMFHLNFFPLISIFISIYSTYAPLFVTFCLSNQLSVSLSIFSLFLFVSPSIYPCIFLFSSGLWAHRKHVCICLGTEIAILVFVYKDKYV